MTKIVLEIADCTACPNCKTERTLGAGFALDYHCSLIRDVEDNHPYGKKIMGYIEYASEIKPVPEWCPIKINN